MQTINNTTKFYWELTATPPAPELSRYSLGLTMLLFALVSWVTDGFYLGDTVTYAVDIKSGKLTEFGHLLWFPVSWLGYQALSFISTRWLGPDVVTNLIWAMLALNWITGLVAVFLVHELAYHFSRHAWIAGLTTAAFIFTQAFLNYAQSGSSYIPGLSCLLLGFWLLLVKDDGRRRWPISAGIALGLSVAFWVPLLFGLPAALLAPMVLLGATKERGRTLALTVVAWGATIGVIFLSGALAQGIYTIAGLRAWIAASSHGADSSGVARTALGLARSFFNLGNDGLLFKRFLVRDPYNPVSLMYLVQSSLWKLGLFYAGLAALIGAWLWKRESHRFFWLWCVNAVPVIGFGLLWQGGDMERYLALLPTTYIGLAYVLAQYRQVRWAQGAVVAFIGALVIINVRAMYKPKVKARETAAEARVKDLVPRLKPNSVLMTTLVQDDLWQFNRLFPFHPLNQAEAFGTIALVEPGMKQIETWREVFAQNTLDVWKRQGDVWISQYVRSQRPRADWYWAEGADKRIRWIEIYEFFSQFELEPPVGGDEGFARIASTQANRDKLAILAQANPVTTQP